MKERELEELFRDAARAAPPASFDEQDVVRGSRRVTARRRMAAAGGSLAAVAVLAGGIGTGAGLFTPEVSTQAGPTQERVETGQGQPPPAGRDQSPRAGEYNSGPSVLGVPKAAKSGCGPADQELAAALARQLPEVTPARTAMPANDCPPGSRTASFQLSRDTAAGTVTVILSSPGAVPSEQRRPGEQQRPDGTRQVTAKADSGRILMVRSNPDDGSPPPYGGRLSEIADGLAGRF